MRALIALLAVGCHARATEDRGGRASVPSVQAAPGVVAVRAAQPALQLLVVGDLEGVLEPCGCTQRPAGGIDRLLAAVAAERARPAPSLLLASGDLWAAAGERAGRVEERQQDRWRLDLLGALLARVRPDVLAPGGADLRAAGERIGAWLRAATPPPLVLGAPGTFDGAVRSARLERGGVQLGITVAALAPGQQPVPLAAEVERELASLRAHGAAFTVALIHAAAPDAARVVAERAGADVVIRSGGVAPASEPEPAPPSRADASVLLDAPRHAERLLVLALWPATGLTAGARWRLQPAAPQASAGDHALVVRAVALDAAAARDAQARAALAQLFARINAFNANRAAAQPVARRAGTSRFYLGAQSCAACHTEAYVWWRGSAHGRAYQTLVARGRQLDLDCVGCHVTGYDRPGGATLVELERLQGVGCESCHGAGSAHADDPRAARSGVTRTVSSALCRGCHDRDHSSGFEPEAARARLLAPGHGAPR